jgi:hypothetical protein
VLLVRDAKEKQKICERKRTSRLEGDYGLEGSQTTVHLGGRVGRIYLARDV